MRDSIQAIRSMRYLHVEGDAVFTLGSIGVEKMMKILLGCRALQNASAWPTMKELKSWGHDIEELNRRILTTLDEGAGRAISPRYADQLKNHVKENAVVPLIFAAFARYGKSGRFHHLDILATDEPGELDPPSEYWEQVELHLRETRPEFHEIPYGDNAALDAYQSRLRGIIADELDAWWFCVHRLGVQGCFGELGKKVGWEIWDDQRAKPANAPESGRPR